MKLIHGVFLWLCLAFTFPGNAMASERDVQMAYDKIAEANERLKVFNKELEWFDYFRSEMALKLEESLKEKKLWEVQLLQDQELRIRLEYIQDSFKKFRESTARVIALSVDDDTGQIVIEATVYLEMTKWFIKYVEEMLFPQGWNESYQAYEKKLSSWMK